VRFDFGLKDNAIERFVEEIIATDFQTTTQTILVAQSGDENDG